jgi:plastocyanin
MRTIPILATVTWAIAGLLAGSHARAAQVEVVVTDARGKPVADAIVTVEAENLPAPVHAPATHVIDQADLVFVPYLQVFRPGDRVVFRNSDRTRHHVYSFSPTKAFEFVLKPGESSTPLLLDRPGVIAAGCNIHDAMITYLFVTAAPWFAQSTATGRVRLSDLPAGALTVRVWHPRLRPGRAALVRHVEVAADASTRVSFALTLRPDSRRRADPERQGY